MSGFRVWGSGFRDWGFHLYAAKGDLAAHAGVGLGFVQHHGLFSLRRQQQTGLQGDGVFRTSSHTQATLHAIFFNETQLGELRIVLQSTGRTGTDATQTQCALVFVDEHMTQR